MNYNVNVILLQPLDLKLLPDNQHNSSKCCLFIFILELLYVMDTERNKIFMKSQKEDRRIRITKQAIKESLIELMLEYPINKISVKMLCESADINRSTFYTHYSNQFDLLRQIQRETVQGIRPYIMNKYFISEHNTIAIPVLIQVLEYARDNQTLFKVLLNESSDSNFQYELMLLAKEKSIEEAHAGYPMDETESKYLSIFEIAGVVSIMKEWLNNDCAETPEKLADLIAKLLFQGVSAFYPN